MIAAKSVGGEDFNNLEAQKFDKNSVWTTGGEIPKAVPSLLVFLTCFTTEWERVEGNLNVFPLHLSSL